MGVRFHETARSSNRERRMTTHRAGNGQPPLRRLIKPGIAMITLVAISGTWFAIQRSNAKPVEKVDVPPSLELALADIATVELRELARALPLSGSLSPVVHSTVKSKIAGTVLEVTAREGQPVRRGEVLARIDPKDMQAELDNKVAVLEKARADLALAVKNRDNSRALLKQNFISQNAFDSSNSVFEANSASVRAAEAQVRLAQNGLHDATITAPLNGIVAKRMVQPGEKVAQDTPLLSVVDLSLMEIEALAPASEIPAVKVGQIAHFHVDGFAERAFEGRVERINPMTEQGSRSITLYISVNNADGALKGGMFAKGELILNKSSAAPAIPISALRDDGGLSYVLAVEDGKLTKHPVQLGLRTERDGLVEVRSGLSPGTQIVAAKIDNLVPGTRVVIKKPTATPAKGS
jgi:membrane fusion protein (multidrug efflux system)